MVALTAEEQETYISILEEQRNVAMTQLARVAARNAYLEQALAAAHAKLQEQERV